jgi:hypothetical protein
MVEKNEERQLVWSFGFGSNMDPDFLRNKKGLEITDHVGAAVIGWKMMMTIKTRMIKVEPAYANACLGKESDEIHGLCF